MSSGTSLLIVVLFVCSLPPTLRISHNQIQQIWSNQSFNDLPMNHEDDDYARLANEIT